jgi:hypothetical protein
VQSVQLVANSAWQGETGKRATGLVDTGAAAVAFFLQGDTGYWSMRTLPPDVQVPTAPTFDARLELSPDTPDGAYPLEVRAVDESGAFGPPSVTTMQVAPVAAAAGRLVVELRWDTEVDLDLHVVDPNGAEVFYRNASSAKPSAAVAAGAPGASSGGVLDLDSNAACNIDGRRREDAVWSGAPPPGHYLARVDTFSLCGQPSAHWTVSATLDGQTLATATGVSVPWDTQYTHDRGGGETALAFDVPAP